MIEEAIERNEENIDKAEGTGRSWPTRTVFREKLNTENGSDS